MDAWHAHHHVVAEAIERVVSAGRGNRPYRQPGPLRELRGDQALDQRRVGCDLVRMHLARHQPALAVGPPMPGAAGGGIPLAESIGDDGQPRRAETGGAQQGHEKEDTARILGEGLDAVMHVDAIDRVIAQECHGDTDERR